MRRLVAALRKTIWPQLFAIAALYGLGVLTINGSGSWRSVLAVCVLASFVGIAAAGQTVVALLGGIDLAIPGVIAFANIATAQLTGDHWPFWIVAPGILILSAAVGAFNGAISKSFNINPLIVTLGVSAILTGAILVWTGGQPTGYAPKWLNGFVAPSGTTFGLPLPPVLAFWGVVAILLVVLLRRTVFGKHVYASGASLPAADLAAGADHARLDVGLRAERDHGGDHRHSARGLHHPGRSSRRHALSLQHDRQRRHRRHVAGRRARRLPAHSARRHHSHRDHDAAGRKQLQRSYAAGAARRDHCCGRRPPTAASRRCRTDYDGGVR